MPLKAPAEEAILGANQFKFQLTQDRKTFAASTFLAVAEIAGLIIYLCGPSEPTQPSFRPNTHRHTVFETLIRWWCYHLCFLSKAIECDNRGLYCKWRIFSPEMTESGPMQTSRVSFFRCTKTFAPKKFLLSAFRNTHHSHAVSPALTGMHSNERTVTPTYIQQHTHSQFCLPAGFASLEAGNTSFNQTGQLRTNFSFVVTAWGPMGLQSLYWQSAVHQFLFRNSLTT